MNENKISEEDRRQVEQLRMDIGVFIRALQKRQKRRQRVQSTIRVVSVVIGLIITLGVTSGISWAMWNYVFAPLLFLPAMPFWNMALIGLVYIATSMGIADLAKRTRRGKKIADEIEKEE